ncbi:unnamed protein product [Withania somnifera]
MSCCGQTIILCERGCGFYGSPSNHNLCSQCYKAFLKEEEEAKIEVGLMSSLTLVDDSTENVGSTMKKQRCMVCKKKIGLIGFSCRCSKGMFCKVHRYPEEHACTFDFKSNGRITSAKENPLCKADKLETRI